MFEIETVKNHTQAVIPLKIIPHNHTATPTITGTAFTRASGTVLYGHYCMEYLLPEGDKLRLIANHDKKTVQIMLFTHHSDLISLLPGERPSSLVAGVINTIQSYLLRGHRYSKPLASAQQKKLNHAIKSINQLTRLLAKERELAPSDYKGQEELRRQVILIIEKCRDKNRMLANDPTVSEGTLGVLLFDAKKIAQHHLFSRIHNVSQQDQMDFSHIPKNNQSTPQILWDSDMHIGQNEQALEEALRTLCEYYKLNPSKKLDNIPANRFEKIEAFFYKLWQDGRHWADYLALKNKPVHKTETITRIDGVSITKITPYYKFRGLSQQGYTSLVELISSVPGCSKECFEATSDKEARQRLAKQSDGHWVVIPNQSCLILRLNKKLITIKYFVHEGLFYPLPDGEDLYQLSQISKRHLYLPERISLSFKAFISRTPVFFTNFYKHIKSFITNHLKNELVNHVHATHEHLGILQPIKQPITLTKKSPCALYEVLENNGVLANGQTLQEFIKEHLTNSAYVIARPNHPPCPPTYTNPFHRTFGIFRHFAGFFVDTSERNPMIGTLAMAAYFYGAGAVFTPQLLSQILTKLHLSGLISGIEPTQKLAHFLSHGTTSEAITAAVTYWQGVVVGGNLDQFFIDAVTVLKDDPTEIAIIVALALSLGYGLTKTFPTLEQEMGEFPYLNYAALGAKGGAAIYDTIMYPGDDWLLGTLKWVLQGGVTLVKLLFSPFIEGAIYGFWDGFINGWKKSGLLFIKTIKQMVSATLDLMLALMTVPLLEIIPLCLYVPFRGITDFISKTLGALGHIKSLGSTLIDLAKTHSQKDYLSSFRLSPLYGFTSPVGHFSSNPVMNVLANLLRIVFIPPLECIKNLLILPLIDLTSLTTRVVLAFLNPCLYFPAIFLGMTLCSFGDLWDNSIGKIFSISAWVVTKTTNWVVKQAENIKQQALSFIQILRGTLYGWAFYEEEAALHNTLTDESYFMSNPMRCEKIPHHNSHCLLHALLGESPIKLNLNEQPPHTSNLYSPLEEKPKTIVNAPAISTRG